MDDAPGIARVQIDGWRATYPGIMPDDLLANLDAASSTSRWRATIETGAALTLVAVEESEVVGFCSIGASRDADGPAHTGEIRAMYVHPDRWRAGIGKALFETVTRNAVQMGFSRLTLWVAADNALGQSFYRTIGFKPDGHEKTVAFSGKPVRELRFLRARLGGV